MHVPNAQTALTKTVHHRISSPAADWIAENLDSGYVVKEKFMGGSGWSSTYVYTTDQGAEYFVKTSGGSKAKGMFDGEALGLKAMYGGWWG